MNNLISPFLNQAPDQLPILHISQVLDQVGLSWPVFGNGLYRLQWTTSIAAQGSWQSVTNVPAIREGRFVVTNAIDASARFYRLVKP